MGRKKLVTKFTSPELEKFYQYCLDMRSRCRGFAKDAEKRWEFERNLEKPHINDDYYRKVSLDWYKEASIWESVLYALEEFCGTQPNTLFPNGRY